MRRLRFAGCGAVALVAIGAVSAAVVREDPSRFDGKVIHDPSARLGVVAEAFDAVQGPDVDPATLAEFRKTHGTSWRAWGDRRGGVATLVEGPGIAWAPAGTILDRAGLSSKAMEFAARYGRGFGIRSNELVLNAAATAATGPDHATVVFDRVVGGIPVEGEQFVLYVNRGSLTAFGTTRWGAIASVPEAKYGAATARELLNLYMGLAADEAVTELDGGTAILVPTLPSGGSDGRYAAAAGAGIDHRLAWRFVLQVAREPGTWVGKVDATTGEILALYDDDKYAFVRGGVQPVSNDGNCSDYGCEVAGMPMPYATVMIGRKSVATNDMGYFGCSKGGSKNSSVNFSGPYVRVQDTCGLGAAGGNCNSDVNFGTGTGTDCTQPSGGLGGNTHAGRDTYYHLNRIKEKARYWLPANTWVNGQLLSKPNINSTCNAYWNGSVNFYKSGGGCRNTGEIAGVVNHEYGHGLDQNDGGNYDNPSEGYADVVAILQERRSCVGRGFFAGGACSGYGDSCLSCTGIRDMDWDARIAHTAATPQNFTGARCGGGGGPCGREVHCESYVPSEAIFDLAARDLPASGLDADSSWQLTEKLFYKSRQGSGGNAFNCALPASDGCGASSWFTKLRNADDDDGNLANGTPHAAAIFAAFARHNIACGTAADSSNLDSSTCPALVQPTVTASAGTNAVTLSWPAVAGAARYLVLRNEIACGYSSNVIATVTGTSYVDDALPAGMPLYYRIQAQGSNTACDGPTSACVSTSAN